WCECLSTGATSASLGSPGNRVSRNRRSQKYCRGSGSSIGGKLASSRGISMSSPAFLASTNDVNAKPKYFTALGHLVFGALVIMKASAKRTGPTYFAEPNGESNLQIVEAVARS